MSASHYRNDSITKLEYTEETRRSLYSMLSYGASHASNEADAILYFGNVISYGALMDKVHQCAAGFLRLGIKKGDRVTIFLPNIPQCVIAVYALNRIGAVCNMVHPLSTKAELEYAVNLTESRCVLVFESNEGLCEGLNVMVIRCRTPYYFPHSTKGLVMAIAYNYSVRKCRRLENVIDWKDVILNGKIFLESNELPEDDAKGSDTAVIMYTGGTTGDSKGVELSNSAMNYSAVELLMHFADGAPHIGDTILSILPAFHAFGFIVVIHVPLSGGLRLVFLPRFNPKQCAKLILDEQINYLAGVPVIYERLYPLIKDKDISCVHHAVCGGDKVTPDLLNRYNAILGKENGLAELRPGYGLTEAAGCCLLTKRNYPEFIEGCVGSPLPGTKICLVEPGTTEVLPDSDEGELCIINPGLMTGYYKNETATRQVLRKHDDGLVWLHTGDVVTLSGGDTVIFKSRYKRMVKINGINVYPTLIENTMSGCSVVDEVCAVAVPWKNDRRIKLYVTLSEGADKEKAKSEIMAYAKSHLNHWSTPFAVTVLEEMPLTKMNKTDYRVLEKRG